VIAQRNCAAFRDLVVDDENGFLVETSDELSRAIERYLHDPACADRHARAGRSAAERHAWSRIAGEIERILIDASGACAEAIAPLVIDDQASVPIAAKVQ
jgi:glycosyltransferase involved in cell wall biosynthesis